MRSHHHLATLNCFIIFQALLLNIRQLAAKGEEAMSCKAEPISPTCPLNISFPFLTSQACGSESSFFMISGCALSNPEKTMRWPNFAGDEATKGSDDNLDGPYVKGFYNPFPDTNKSGLIDLTWNQALINKSPPPAACQSLAPLDQIIAHYLPQSIHLKSFAHSAFQLTPSNIILLFNCSSSADSHKLEKNSRACISYEQGCKNLQSSNCYQYNIPDSQELNLHEVMQAESLNCENGMFFVVPDDQLSNISHVSQWSPGLIQLSWSTNNNPWMASTLKSCEGCLHTNGSCGYNSDDNFQCYCDHNKVSDTNCTSGCEGISCNTRAIIGIVVASTLVAMVIVTMLVLWVYKRKRGYSTKSFTSSSSNRLFTQRAYTLSKKFGPVSTKEFSFESLSKATKSFADENMIGDGGFGAVYLGVLKDGRKVAIKRLYHDNFRRMDHFYNEIKILSTLNHPNLVKLYGFCCQDSSDLLLVFEYASNGTISDQLHDATKPVMPWKTRLNIARETAEALSYLHNLVSPPIYHRDVKTTNILLDDDLHAKLADFGLSRLVPLQATHVSTAPQGTPGYLDPDYHESYQLTDKSDVYSFGVVLMELVSAKLAVDMSRDRREINLSSLALMKIGCGQWEDLVDSRLEMKKNPDVEKMVKRVIEIGFMCLHAEKDSRPTMKYIAETLASLCREFEYGHNDDVNGTFSLKVGINAPSPVDETSLLIKSKSSSKSSVSADSPPSSADWTSSNASSYVKSF